MADRVTDPATDLRSDPKTTGLRSDPKTAEIRPQDRRSDPSLKNRILKEMALFGALFLVGLVVLPLLIYLVGEAVFGAYEGAGFSAFYGQLHGEFRAAEPAVVFLLLAPYILWQLLRATVRVFRNLRQESGRPG